MPKITGPNIAQHVADQEAAVFAAAIALFEDLGVDAVSMGAIAENVGLARSSLYRYFPNKAAIVNRWFSTTMEPLIAESERIARSDETTAERFMAWLQCQFEFLAEPANQIMIHAALESNEMTDLQRAEIVARHQALYATLQTIIARPNPDAHTDIVMSARARLIAGLFRHVEGLQRAGIPDEVVRKEVIRIASLAADIEHGNVAAPTAD